MDAKAIPLLRLETAAYRSKARAASVLIELYKERHEVLRAAGASVRMWFVLQQTKQVNVLIGLLPRDFDQEDREWCMAAAVDFFELSQKINEVLEKSPENQYFSLFRRWAEDAVCETEDAAETLAIAADQEITDCIRKEIRSAINDES